MPGISNRAVLVVAMVVLGSSLAPAARAAETQAAPVPADAAVKADAVHGLRVAFYDFYPKDAAGIDSLEIAKNWIGRNAPVLTYDLGLATIDSPRGGEMTIDARKIELGRFLLGDKEYARRKDAAKGDVKAFPERLNAPVGPRTIMVFTAFVKVDKPGVYAISTPVDDGDETSVGGVVVHARAGFGGINPNPESPENVGRAEFTKAGIYPVQVILWDRDPGGIGVHVFSNVDPKGERHANGQVLLTFLSEPKKAGKPAK